MPIMFFLMADQEQIFNSEWQSKIGASITDTGNALEFEEAVKFGKGIRVVVGILGKINERRHDFDASDQPSYDAPAGVSE